MVNASFDLQIDLQFTHAHLKLNTVYSTFPIEIHTV